MRRTLLIATAIVLGIGVSAGGLVLIHDAAGTAAGTGADPLAGAERAAASFAWALLLYAVMIGGVLANYLYSAASDRAAAGQPFAGPGELLSSLASAPRLWMALAVSPFLFHGIHLAAGAAPEGGTALFFAFQNGFFWQAVFAGFQQKQAAADAATPVPA